MRGVRLAVATSVVLLGVATPAAAVDPPELEKAYTEHLGQLVTAPGKGGVNELNNRANGTRGMPGTDLGVSFESRGRLYFLFGDSSLVFSSRAFVEGGGTLFDDSIAVTDARSADRFQMPSLTWAAGADGSFAPLRVPGASHGSFEVPVEGIHANGRTYVFFVSGWHSGSHDHQVLGHFDADTMQTGRFVLDQVVETLALPERQRGRVPGLRLPLRRRQPVPPERGFGWPASARMRSTVTINGATSASRSGTVACPGCRAKATPARSLGTTRPASASCPCAAIPGAASS